MPNAYSIKVRGVVQGVGFRPFVYRLARTNGLTGWVLNEDEGVEIHLEGEESTLRVFIEELKTQPPPAASIVTLRVMPAEPAGCTEFLILTSQRQRGRRGYLRSAGADGARRRGSTRPRRRR